MECPVCQLRSTGGRCTCGFEFETGDRRSVALRARRDRERGSRTMKLGFALLAVVPIGAIIGLPLVGLVASLMLLSPLVVAGGATVAQGAYRRHSAQRLLARATAPLPLPAARVLEP